MYLHLGNETVIDTDNIIGIFDLDTSTVSKHTRDLLALAQKDKKVINVSFELPKSFILYNYSGEISVYISQISTSTLIRRMEKKENYYEIT